MIWRVVLVEDGDFVRSAWARAVSECKELELLAALPNCTQALQFLQAHGPSVDVLLTDLGLPDGSGIDLIRFQKAHNPACESLVMSVFGDEDSVIRSIEAGALGYIQKDATSSDVASVILELKAGGSPISPLIARRLMQRLVAGTSAQGTPPAQPGGPRGSALATLSARELEVLSTMARGFSHAEVAEQMCLSVFTVRTHVKRIYEKLTVRSKTEAVYQARRMGLLP